MNISIGKRWEAYIEELLAEGRYASASEIMREGLRLVEEREQKLSALREKLDASIERGGSHSIDDVRSSVKATLDSWEKKNSKRAA
jgi:antitoxin ParD1/3/4